MKKQSKMNIVLCFVVLVFAGFQTLSAQNVGIGDATFTPDANAMLEVKSADKGFLPPRVALTGTANVAPLSAHVAGMVVYNTATAGDVTPGLYLNDGAKWIALMPVVYTAGDGIEINSNVISTSGGGGGAFDPTLIYITNGF